MALDRDRKRRICLAKSASGFIDFSLILKLKGQKSGGLHEQRCTLHVTQTPLKNSTLGSVPTLTHLLTYFILSPFCNASVSQRWILIPYPFDLFTSPTIWHNLYPKLHSPTSKYISVR